jgi:toxin ParE1/3/4
VGDYELAPAAEVDLFEIARYTLSTWGSEQAARYEVSLEAHFRAIARGDVRTRAPFPDRPELVSSRCEHHFVFALRRDGRPVLIVAVLHERMDLMTRLRERIEPGT